MEQDQIRQITEIIRDCEEIQTSGESEYAKEQEKVSAYNRIKDVLGG